FLPAAQPDRAIRGSLRTHRLGLPRVAAWATVARRRTQPRALTDVPMRIEIVTIGNEVLSGRTFDTNFVFLARALEEASVVVAWHTTVGDVAEAIGDALKLALSRAHAVIMTGGPGPTPDDLTPKAAPTA